MIPIESIERAAADLPRFGATAQVVAARELVIRITRAVEALVGYYLGTGATTPPVPTRQPVTG